MSKIINGKCALCGLEKDLQLSHIIPNFVGKKLFKTSPGSIRATNNPNVVSQDIEKHYLLCHDCEELFSAKERWVANNIFNPYQDKKYRSFEYDNNLAYFIVSLSWRSLYLDLADFIKDKNIGKENLLKLFLVEKDMRDFLLGKTTVIPLLQNHLFFLDRIQYAYNFDMHKFPSVAMHRSICSYTAYNGNTIFTVSNLMGILLVTFYSMESNEKWINTKIDFQNGIINAENQHMTSVVGQEIQHWVELSEEAQKSISPKQQEKIKAKFINAGENIKDYPIFQDFLDDMNLQNIDE